MIFGKNICRWGMLLLLWGSTLSVAGAEPPQLILSIKPEFAYRKERLLQEYDLTVKRENYDIGFTVVTGMEGWSSGDIRDQIKDQYAQEIRFIEVDDLVAPDQWLNDAELSKQWHHGAIRTKEAWAITDTYRGLIGVVDSGVNRSHPDLQGVTLPGYNVVRNVVDTSTDPAGHGTKVAGVIGAVGDNRQQGSGIVKNATILPVRISDRSDGFARYSDMAAGVQYAADRGAGVINLSYNGVCESAVMEASAQYAYHKGSWLVASAGNSSSFHPCGGSPYVIYVGSLDQEGKKSDFSNWGRFLDIMAPGSDIWTTTTDGGFNSTFGTSFSAPMVTGVIALIKETNPHLTPSQIEKILQEQSVDLGGPGRDDTYGWGKLDAYRAVLEAKNLLPPVIEDDPEVIDPYSPPLPEDDPQTIDPIETDNPFCGNRIPETGEGCDDGNKRSGDGCSSDCQTEPSVCGDGQKSHREGCDDGGQVPGDGCSGTCTKEVSYCGNSFQEFGEGCDDGNKQSEDGCSAQCITEPSVCGDTVQSFKEGCDDGNRIPGDGCDENCYREIAFCGNGNKEFGEECDDGNNVSGDGCSSGCEEDEIITESFEHRTPRDTVASLSFAEVLAVWEQRNLPFEPLFEHYEGVEVPSEEDLNFLENRLQHYHQRAQQESADASIKDLIALQKVILSQLRSFAHVTLESERITQILRGGSRVQKICINQKRLLDYFGETREYFEHIQNRNRLVISFVSKYTELSEQWNIAEIGVDTTDIDKASRDLQRFEDSVKEDCPKVEAE